MKTRRNLLLSLFSLFCIAAMAASPLTDITPAAVGGIYDDALAPGWMNWSWGAAVDFNANQPVHSGTRSIKVDYSGGWQGFYLAHAGVDTTGFASLRFFIHGGSSGGQPISVYANYNGSTQGPSVSIPAPLANQWTEVRLPLTSLIAPNAVLTGIVWQNNSNNDQQPFYLDDIQLSDDADPNGPILDQPGLNPRAVRPGGYNTAQVRVHVTDPQGAADIQSVTVDASALGRGTVNLKDDGLSGDGAANDGIYGASLSAVPGTPGQEITLTATARDYAGHQSSLQIASLLVLSPPGGSIPASLPQHFGWGSNAWDINPASVSYDWQVKSGVPWNYLYQYFTYGWEGWGSAPIQNFVGYAWSHQYVPVVTLYMMLDVPPNCGESGNCYAGKLQNPATVNSYLTSLYRAAQEASGSQPVIFNLEPDFYGYMQQYTNLGGRPAGVRQDDPTSIPVALNQMGYPNTLAGFGQYMVNLIHGTAPNVIAAPMASIWSTNGDPQSTTSEGAVQMAQRTAAFIDAMGGAQADLLVVEWSDRDAGTGLRPLWDAADRSLPRHTRAILWENALSTASAKRLLLWQVPAGNMALDNTPQHYRDNHADYAFHHTRELYEAGIIGVAFGGGDGNSSQVWTDGGFIAAQAAQAYAPPPAPANFSASGVDGPAVHIAWTANNDPNIAGQRIFYQPAGGGQKISMEVGQRSSLTLVLPYAGQWIVQAAAYSITGSSGTLSAALNITTTRDPVHLYLPMTIR